MKSNKSTVIENAKSIIKEDSESTLSINSHSSLNSTLAKQIQVRLGLQEIDKLALNYHLVAQKVVD